jgi:hypothetical protein
LSRLAIGRIAGLGANLHVRFKSEENAQPPKAVSALRLPGAAHALLRAVFNLL